MASAFISHASQDREVAERICSFLEERGIRCWIAPRDVRPGRKYGEEIVDGIHGADAVVLVLSENANSSTFVEREIERAVSYGKPTLPVRVREVQPSRSLELFISNAHWIDAWKPPMEQYLDRLADSIRSLSPEGGGATEAKRVVAGESGDRHKSTARFLGIVLAALIILGVGAAATWWLLGRQESRSDNRPGARARPEPSPALVAIATPINAQAKPVVTPEIPAPDRISSTPNVQVTPYPTVERKQEVREAVDTDSGASNTPSANVSDVLATIRNTRGRARDHAIEENLQRLPPQITTDDLLAITNGSFDRTSVIKLLSNRLPNPIRVEDTLRILGNSASRERSYLIEILGSHLPPALTVKELLALIEQAYGRSDVIRQLAGRLPNPLAMEETLQILGNTTSRERFGLIEMLGARMPHKMTVKDLSAIIEGSYDRNGTIQRLVSRLPNPLSLEETLQILDDTVSRERTGLIEMLSSRIPQNLSAKELLSVIEAVYDRNGIIKLLVNRLPNPLPFDDLQLILGPTSSRERYGLIEILHSRVPTGLSPAQVSSLVEGSYDPQDAEKFLRH